MKLLIILAVVALAVARPDDELYDAKYDNIDMDEVVNNPRLLESYANCLLGKGKCTPEGNDLKAKVPEGIETSCAKCTSKQKILIAKFAMAIKSLFPDIHEQIYSTYDAPHKRVSEYDDFINKNKS